MINRVVKVDSEALKDSAVNEEQWREDAACNSGNADVFYGPDGERGLSKSRRERQALAICASCAVRSQCLDFALGIKEPYGIWGGLNEKDRNDLLIGRSRPKLPNYRANSRN